MKKRLLPLCVALCLGAHAHAAQLTTYLTEWSGYAQGDYPAYPFDQSYPNNYADNTVIKNPDMVSKAQHSDVVTFAFLQVWNQDLINQYAGQAQQSWLGVLHFDDLWGDLSNQKVSDYSMWKTLCGTGAGSFTQGTCAAVQMSGMTHQNQVFNYATDDVGQMDNFGAFLKLDTDAHKVISIGGANTTSNASVSTKTFQTIFANQTTFVNSLAAFVTGLQGHGFNANSGVDYDFEPPIDANGSQVAPNAATTTDYQHLFDLVVATRQKLGPDAYVSVTLTANESYLDAINASVEGGWFKQIASYVNAINIMTYDLHGPWSLSSDPGTLGHIMLKQPTNLSHTYSINYASQEVMAKVLSYGVSADKLQLGLASYGRGFSGVAPGSNASLPGFDQAWTGTSTFPSNLADSSGMLPYKSVQALLLQGYSQYNVMDDNDSVIASYLYSPSLQQMVGYMSPDLLDTTCAYVKEQGLQGAILWSADTDASDDGSQGVSLVSRYNQSCRAS